MNSLIYIFDRKKKNHKHFFKSSFNSILEKKQINQILKVKNLVIFLNSIRKTSKMVGMFFISDLKKNFLSNNTDFIDYILINKKKINIFLNIYDILYIKNVCKNLKIYFNKSSNIIIKLKFTGGGRSSCVDNIIYILFKMYVFLNKNFLSGEQAKNIDNKKIKSSQNEEKNKVVKYGVFTVLKSQLEYHYKKKTTDKNSLYDNKLIICVKKYSKQDNRILERKKVGKSGARRSEQFSKR